MNTENNRSITYRGTVVWVSPILTKPGKNGHAFTSRTVVVSPDPESEKPTMLLLTLKKGVKEDRTQLITERHKGATGTVEFFPDVRFWDDPKTGQRKAFGDNVLWKVAFDDLASIAPSEPDSDAEPVDDDMPF